MTTRFIKLKFDAYHFIGEGESEPIAKKLGFRNKAVFECIASHQDMNCISDTTIDQISNLTGISRGTVIKAVQELESFTYEGKPILEKMQFYNGEKKKNLYKILTNPLVSCFNERDLGEVSSPKFVPLDNSNSPKFVLTKEQSSKEIKELNNNQSEECSMKRELKNKDIIAVFCEAYEKKNLAPYKRNYKMDNKFTTQFLQSVQTLDADLKNNEVKRIVEVIVESYPKWQRDLNKYPLTIRTLSYGWVIEKAHVEVKKEKENVSQMVEVSVEATVTTQKSVSSIMDRIKKKQGGSK